MKTVLSLSPARLVASALLLASISAGCGTGEYNRRMDASLERLQTTGKFTAFLHTSPTEVDGGLFSYRLPKIFDASSKSWAEGNKGEVELPVIKARIQPPFVDLPGFRFCYEVFPKNNTGEHEVMYHYFAATKSTEKSAAEIADTIQKKVQAKFPDASAAWETIQLDTPESTTLECRKISAHGSQQFDRTPIGKEFMRSDGQFELYLVSNSGYHVLMGWRAMTAVAKETRLSEIAAASVGTLVIQAVGSTKTP